jgi:serine/threonine protein kinase
MGAVYLAARADQAFQKEVAIKLIKRGQDTEDVIHRFRSERQILASLDHPNITRLFDGGTTEDGLPYFVMEYIQGEPIDKYCDTHKVPITERLRLFQSVTAAVHFAHQHLIIHRDIKPGNILVTEEGVPRLLDFGIAKLLAAEPSVPDRTMTMARRMTPESASPEQVRGGNITTATSCSPVITLTGCQASRRKKWNGPSARKILKSPAPQSTARRAMPLRNP